ncbi:MAG: TIGR01212 family radical SAM protein, partial [Brevinematales bacterium]
KLMERDEYIELLLGLMPEIPPGIVIHRLFGECRRDRLVAPLWTLEKQKNLALFERLMKERGIRQGSRL